MSDAVSNARKWLNGMLTQGGVALPKKRERVTTYFPMSEGMNHVDRLLAEIDRLTPRVVETDDELDGLREETVIRDSRGYVFERWYGGPSRSAWAEIGTGKALNGPPSLPACVLWTPEDGA